MENTFGKDTTMLFTRYEKMSNNFSQLKNKSSLYTNTEWIVTEKIHGANFSFHTDGENVRVAKRSDLLKQEDNFFNFQSAEFMTTYPEKMKDVYSAVCQINDGKEIIQVSIYGELFGGKYFVDGKNIAKHKEIQAEIQYSPNIEWCAFDISYRAKDNPNNHEYLDADEAMKIFEDYDIFHVKPLFVGTMNQALGYELGFDSTIPAILKLPPLEKGTNKAEGIVVRPIKNRTLRKKEKERIIIKIKLEGFVEVCNINRKTGPKSMASSVMAYATEQRLANAISKIGHALNKEIEEEIIEEFMTDIFVDMEECDDQLHEKWTTTDEPEKNKIKDIIKRKATGLIKKRESSSHDRTCDINQP